MMKRTAALLAALAVLFALAGCGVSQDEYDTLLAERDSLSQERDELVGQVEDLTGQVEDLTGQLEEMRQQVLIPQLREEAAPVQAAIDGIGEVTLDRQDTVAGARQLYDTLREEAREYVENYETLTAAETKIEELRAAQSAEEKAQAYKASCQGGCAYSELARDPDSYVGKQVKFTGKVIQVTEGLGITAMRVNVTQGRYTWSDTMYVTYIPASGEGRILEDDIITFYGEMQPLKTYTTVLGASVTIPAVNAKYIDVQ